MTLNVLIGHAGIPKNQIENEVKALEALSDLVRQVMFDPEVDGEIVNENGKKVETLKLNPNKGGWESAIALTQMKHTLNSTGQINAFQYKILKDVLEAQKKNLTDEEYKILETLLGRHNFHEV